MTNTLNPGARSLPILIVAVTMKVAIPMTYDDPIKKTSLKKVHLLYKG